MSLRVSDHAILRYAERVMGLDVEMIKERLTSVSEKAAQVLGKARFPIEECVVVVKDNTVTTIFPKKTKKKKPKNYRGFLNFDIG